MNKQSSIFLFFMLLLLEGICFGQQVALSDSTKQGAKGNGNGNGDSEELVLDDIQIKGKVEKPGVIIIPKRIEPKLEEKELERDFEKELKGEYEDIYRPDNELRKVERVESIKKAIDKDRDK